MRPLAVAMIVLLSASSAHAVPITGFAVGTVTMDRVSLGFYPVPYIFTVGESVSVRFTYDTDPVFQQPGGGAWIEFDITTGGGFAFRTSIPTFTRVVDTGEGLTLVAFRDPWIIDLRFVGDTGRIEYSRDLGAPGEGFIASLTRVASPVPEPSTLALGLVGTAVAGLARRGWTRRRAAA